MATASNKAKMGPVMRHRSLPYSIEAEQSVLGGLVLDNKAWPAVSAILKEDDFYRGDHRLLFVRMGELLAAGKPCDFVTLCEALRARGELESAGGVVYVGSITMDTPSSSNVTAYAQIVFERAMLRRLISAGEWIGDIGEAPDGQAFEALIGRGLQRLEVLLARSAAMADQSWQKHLVRTESGAAKATLANIVAVLDLHPYWRDKLKLDLRSHQIRKCGVPVGEPIGMFGDADAVEVAAWMGRPDTLKFSASTTQVRDAVLAVASRRPFNPLVEWLDTLAWDGEERIPTFFSDFCGSPQNEYTSAVAWSFFGGAIARARKPGSKVDLMLVLEGSQGARKTSLLIALAGPEYYAEAMESPAQKDFYQSLQGRWIIEIAEMQSFSRVEVAKVKQAITAQWDFYRPSYGHFAQNYPRQCVFVGTTNEDDYLRDATGARRFLPVRVADIDVEAVLGVRDQLWAEADAKYKRGDAYWRLPASAQAEQDARYQEDSWLDVMVRWLDGKAPDERYPDGIAAIIKETNTTQLLNKAIGVETGKHGKTEQQRIGSIMRRLGWARVQKRIDGRVHWVYRRPASTSPEVGA